MIKFETGRCSYDEVRDHQRKESQIKGELLLINHMKDEHIPVWTPNWGWSVFLNFTRDWCLLLSDGLMLMFWKHSTFWASWTWSSSDASTCIYRNYRQTPTVIQRCLQKGLEDHGYRPHHVGSCSLRSDGLQAFCTEKVLSSFKQSLTQQAQGKGNRRKARGQAGRPTTDFTCVQCSRDCHSRIEHSSHTRSRLCISITTQSATP